MRHKILSDGAKELSYEIREIVKKGDLLRKLGLKLYWENIGDPIQKNNEVPLWMREIISELTMDEKSYSYCHSKGVFSTREFLAEQTNAKGGTQITAEDILFFNGLGDAIAKVYQFINQNLRVIGPSPAYSTHSSAEAAHANSEPITYKLDPNNHWYPDLDDLYNKVKYNKNIIGILVINPDNPTGMVYPLETLQRIVDIAKEFNLMIISDEIYLNITYNGAKAYSLAEVIGDAVPGIAMKGISKELPWPGSRCGWMEFYNREQHQDFSKFCSAMENAKMIEVCSTTLPQLAIPKIMGDPRFKSYRENLNQKIGKRSKYIAEILGQLPELQFNETYGAFYNTIIFKEGVLNDKQILHIEDSMMRSLVESWIRPDMNLDQRFVYYLLGAKGICVVPISSFCSDLKGFRVTLLEENEETLEHIFTTLRDALREYFNSSK